MSARSASAQAIGMAGVTDATASAVAELAGLRVENHSRDAVLMRVAELAITIVPSSNAAGCTLLLDGRPVAGGYTDSCLDATEARWREREDGPEQTAVQKGSIVVISDLGAEFPDLAEGISAASVLTAPLLVETGRAAVLTLYARSRQAFDSVSLEQLAPFLSQASAAVANADAYATASSLNDQLRDALASRAVIEQAKGAIMARRRVSPEAAFELLRRSSQRRNVKLRDVAQEVVDSTRGK